jgi:hypothetical protein
VPAKDRYHDTVIRALGKQGWHTTHEQFGLQLGTRWLWIDIRAIKEMEELTVLVEVKGFEKMRSPIDYLAHVIGKYILYQAALNYVGDTTPLYLAFPLAAAEGILMEPIGQVALDYARVRRIVFDPQNQEVLQWIS